MRARKETRKRIVHSETYMHIKGILCNSILCECLQLIFNCVQSILHTFIQTLVWFVSVRCAFSELLFPDPDQVFEFFYLNILSLSRNIAHLSIIMVTFLIF